MKTFRSLLTLALGVFFLAGCSKSTDPEPAVVFSDDTVAASEWGGGSGTEADPWQIKTAEQLKWLVEQANDRNSPEPFTGKYFKLMVDIKVTASGWVPIGESIASAVGFQRHFAGIFDGNGKTISGTLKGNVKYMGLFGWLKDNALVKNLSITADIVNEYKNGDSYSGGIAGYVTSSIIKDCTVSGITIKHGDIRNQVGSIAGYGYYGTSIVDCSVDNVTIDINIYDDTWGISYAGGIIGAMETTSIVGMNAPCSITGCSVKNLKLTVFGYDGNVGGIVGQAVNIYNVESIVADCSVTGSTISCLSDITQYDSYVGGIVGAGYAYNLKRCTVTGSTITGEAEDYEIGAVIGHDSGCDITDCTATGTTVTTN